MSDLNYQIEDMVCSAMKVAAARNGAGTDLRPVLNTMIDEERGTVYYKQVLAMTTRGSMMQGQAIWDTTGMPQSFVKGFASSAATVVLEGNAAPGTSFNFPTQLAAAGYLPLRPGKVAVVIKTTPPLHAADYNMDGNLLGSGVWGTVDYQTGEVNLTLADAPSGNADIVAIIDQVMEGAPNIPQINYVLASKAVVANLFALKDTVGLEQSYAMRRRFGMNRETCH